MAAYDNAKRERRRTPAASAAAAASLVLAALGASSLLSASSDSSSSSSALLRAVTTTTPDHAGDDGDVCYNVPTLYDLDPHAIDKFDRMIEKDIANWDGFVLPTLITLDGNPLFRTTVRENNWPARSMAWNDTYAVAEDDTIDRSKCDVGELEGHGVWKEPPTDRAERTEARTVEGGNYVAFSGWYVGNFGHFVHDHVPAIAWLRSKVDPSTRFLLPHHPLHEDILNVVDPTFVRDRVTWIGYGETVKVNGRLTVLVPSRNDPFPCGFPQTSSVLTEHLRAWLEESHRDVWERKERETKKVIYYSRAGGTARRNVMPEIEERIIGRIREKMAEIGRNPEDLVIFNGKGPDGQTISIQEQFDLFSSADVAIGPHGSGLTNIIWMDPRRRPCGDGRHNKVLEFSSSYRTKNVQNGAFSSYWFLFGSTPWIDYRYLYYMPASTPQVIVVNFRAFEQALEAMWGAGGGEEEVPAVESSQVA